MTEIAGGKKMYFEFNHMDNLNGLWLILFTFVLKYVTWSRDESDVTTIDIELQA